MTSQIVGPKPKENVGPLVQKVGENVPPKAQKDKAFSFLHGLSLSQLVMVFYICCLMSI